MKKVVFTLLILVFSIHASFGWGATGHRATGWIANKYLNKKARKALNKILNGQSLAMLTTWMDEVRSDSAYSHMTDWHWVTIPHGSTYDQCEKNPNGDIIQTLERIYKELKSKTLSPQQELMNIKMLIHLVGDIHQPLHVGARDDKGGNDVRLQWFKEDTNLHRVWDSDMIDETHLSFTELAQSLDTPSENQINAWQKSSFREWAKESQSYDAQVYNFKGTRLGYKYSYENYHTVRLRLLQAGVRIAGILNEIYGK